ncbi:hypothetical protein MKX03_012415 [Papaver bracteatum]|nr:hypothetical protein MKX03_012415 [Papaver bracteatum]
MEEVKSKGIQLYGKWSSSYCLRVELALKLKGIPFENIVEDTKNKSEALLKYNPVHKKIPVLVHNGRAIAESLVILEYIDETWTHAPSLLPQDAYERSKARFWANFYDQKFLPSSSAVMKSKGAEERKKAVEDLLENTRLLEEGLWNSEFEEKSKTPYLSGEAPGFLDIVIGMSACSHKAVEEVFGIRLMDPQKHPKLLSWITIMKDHPIVKETLPRHEELVKAIRMFINA